MSATKLQRHVTERIRQLLAAQSKTQGDLAAALGVNKSWLSRRMNGGIPIKLDELAHIAAHLDVTVVVDLVPAGDVSEQATQPAH